jgi:hypothetical protein
MGYYIKLVEVRMNIPNTPEVLSALKEINTTYHRLKRGFTRISKETRHHFSWMPENYDKTVTTIEEIFTLLGFECTTENDYVTIEDYDDKQGQEMLFIAAIAPYLANGSYMKFIGEDERELYYTIRDGKLYRGDKVYTGTFISEKYICYAIDLYSDKSINEQIDEKLKQEAHMDI